MTETTFEPPEGDDAKQFDPQAWQALGMSREEGLAWFKHRMQPGDALRWRRAGVSEPIEAVRWKIAGVGPERVGEWIYAKIDAREAVAWNELGFSVAEAHKHKRVGRTPVQAYGRKQRLHVAAAPAVSSAGSRAAGFGPHRFMEAVRQQNPRIMQSYMHRQWFDDEAIAWATHGFDASDALAWKELGLTPVEAERHQAQDMSPMQTAKAWWQAGIPVDEVADWIGAGLTPEEAARQRANGVTVEQAAVLRSLRKNQ